MADVANEDVLGGVRAFGGDSALLVRLDDARRRPAQLADDDVDGVRDGVELVVARGNLQPSRRIAAGDQLEHLQEFDDAITLELERRAVAVHARRPFSHAIASPSSENNCAGMPGFAMRRCTLPIIRPNGLASIKSAIAKNRSTSVCPE